MTNAELLDERALQLLLELRRTIRRRYALVPRCALILCARVEAPSLEDSRVSKLLNKADETRAAWPDRVEYQPMSVAAFGSAMRTIIEQNLRAEFAEDVDARATLIQFGKWTHANWWLMTELVKKLDNALGPLRADTPRILTQTVIDKVQQIWQVPKT